MLAGHFHWRSETNYRWDFQVITVCIDVLLSDSILLVVVSHFNWFLFSHSKFPVLFSKGSEIRSFAFLCPGTSFQCSTCLLQSLKVLLIALPGILQAGSQEPTTGSSQKSCVMFYNKLFFFLAYSEELLALHPTPKLEDHPSLASHDWLFSIFALPSYVEHLLHLHP